MGFLPSLARQHAWYPWVYLVSSLYRCAKCGCDQETQEHIFDCADHSAAKEYFGRKYQEFQPENHTLVDPSQLHPWDLLGLLQGRADPRWEQVVPHLRHGENNPLSTSSIVKQLLRASLETWYHAIWIPRCQRTIEQERGHGLTQATKIRRMRVAARGHTHTRPSPTPSLPSSFIEKTDDRKILYCRFLSRLMHGTVWHKP